MTTEEAKNLAVGTKLVVIDAGSGSPKNGSIVTVKKVISEGSYIRLVEDDGDYFSSRFKVATRVGTFKSMTPKADAEALKDKKRIEALLAKKENAAKRATDEANRLRVELNRINTFLGL